MMKKLVLIFIFLPFMVHAADTLLVTVKESGGNYTNVEAALDGHEQNLVTNDSVLVIEISGTWSSADVAEVSIDGYTTNYTHPIIVRAIGDSRHDGKWNTTAYRHERPTRVLYGAFAIYEDCVRLEWLQIHQKTTSQYDCAINDYDNNGGDNNDVQISNCILKGTDGTNINRKGVNTDGDGGWDVWNCLIYDFRGTSSRGIETKEGVHVYNNTIWACSAGIYVSTVDGDDSTLAYNNLVGDCVGDNYGGIKEFHPDSDYNGSDDATSTGGANDHINHTFKFVDSTAGDFHLTSADTGATDYGTNLSADPDRPFSDDIDGETRSGTWDMGADEYIGAAVGAHLRKVNVRKAKIQ